MVIDPKELTSEENEVVKAFTKWCDNIYKIYVNKDYDIKFGYKITMNENVASIDKCIYVTSSRHVPFVYGMFLDGRRPKGTISLYESQLQEMNVSFIRNTYEDALKRAQAAYEVEMLNINNKYKSILDEIKKQL